MDGKRATPGNRRGERLWFAAGLVWCLFIAGQSARSDEYRDACDSSRISWDVQAQDQQIAIDIHRRDGIEFHAGTAAESLELVSAVNGRTAQLVHELPVGLVIEELTASVWVKSNRAGAVLALRIRLPRQLDPRTGEPFTLVLPGGTYASVDRWQELTCQTLEPDVNRQLSLLRGQLIGLPEAVAIDTRNMYVDQVLLRVPVEPGRTSIQVDELRFGPIVRPTSELTDPTNVLADSEAERPEIPIRVEPDRLLVNNQPFFPRIVPYHLEQLDELQKTGVNVVWVESYTDRVLMEALQQRKIWVMTAPPHAIPASAESPLNIPASHLMPLSTETSPVLLWTVGTRIPGSELGSVQEWINQIETADRCYSRARPIIADVMQREREFSRHVSLLGTSRHFLNTSFSPLQYRAYLASRRQRALPDVFNWTWIQTEPSTAHLATRDPDRQLPIAVEAEQIWMQAWAAIAAGHKALGYWSYTPLDADSPAAQERRIALAILNSQIELLEPWLAAGKVVDTIPVTIGPRTGSDAGRWSLGFRPAAGETNPRTAATGSDASRPQLSRAEQEVQASVIESEFGRLLLVAWYEEGAQFQPGPMAARDVRMKVRGVEMARAWEVSTTGVRPSRSERVAGGMEVQLDDLDQFAFIVITNDPGLEERLSQKMRTLRPRCGRLWTELADIRLNRIRQTHEMLTHVAPPIHDAPSLLAAADNAVQRAQAELQRTQYDAARDESRRALQLLRSLERRHWEQAAAPLSQPSSSPHAISFSTLPDHWRLVNSLRSQMTAGAENMLRSGGFEDLDTMMAAGWKPEIQGPETVQHLAELHPDAAEGRVQRAAGGVP